jgi:hypothetical protein
MTTKSTSAHTLAPISINDQTDLSKIWEPFFGPALKGPIITDPYTRQANQNLALPDAYKGKSTFLGRIIEEQVLTEDDWYTAVMLPITTSETLSITWSRWTFDQHRTEIVPEEAPSRLITNRKSQHSAAMERSGIAMQLEHGFMKTQDGIDNYILNLRQMAYAVSETNKADVISAYLNAEDVNRTWEHRHGHYNSRTIRQRLDMDRDTWAVAQKDEKGLEKLDAKSDEEMMRYKGLANTWLLPPKLKLLAQFQPHKTDYYLSGKAWSYDAKENFGILGNKRVFLMRQYDIDAHELLDISLRQRQIGQYYTMVDRNSDARTEDDRYTPEERSIIVYDEDSDYWAKLVLQTGIDNCDIFDKQGKLLPPDSYSSKKGGLYFVPHTEDITHDFLVMPENDGAKNGKSVAIEVFGQMRERHLKTASMIGIARIAAQALHLSPEESTKVVNTLNQLTETNNTALSAAAIADLFDTDKLKSLNNDFKTYASVAVPGNQYYDFKAGANPIQTRQINKDPAVTKVLNGLRTIFPGSIFLDDHWASPAGGIITSPVNRAVVESLLGGVGLSVWIRKTGGATGQDTLTTMDATNKVTLQSLLPLIANSAPNTTTAARQALGKSLEALFGFTQNNGAFGDYAGEPYVEDDNDDDSDLASAAGKFQILKAIRRAPDGKGDAAVFDGTKTIMPGGAKQGSFVFRSRLIALVQQIILRTVLTKNTDETLNKLVAIFDKLTRVITSKDGAGLKPTGGNFTLTALWDRTIQTLGGDLEANFGKGTLPDTAQARQELALLDANNADIVQAINVEFGIPQNEKAFYITPMVLSLAQLRGLVDEYAPANANVAAVQAKLDKATVTVSSPQRLEPIVSGADFLSLKALLDKGDLKDNLNWKSESIQLTSLGRQLRLQRDALSEKRARAADDDEDDDGGDRKRRRFNYGAIRAPQRGRSGRGAMPLPESDDEDLQDGTTNINVPLDAFVPNLLNKRFTKRFERIDRQMVNPLYKFIAKILAGTPVTHKALTAMNTNGVNIPMGFLVVGPHMNYHMHFGIKAQAGSETGNTYLKDVSFEVGDNPQVKMHYGHLTLYTTVIIREPKNVRVFYDICGARCLGGAGVKPIDLTKYDAAAQQYGDGSLLYLAVAYEEKEFQNPLDISGHFAYFTDTSNTDRNNDKKPHYSTAYRYNAKHGWRKAEDVGKYDVEQHFHPLVFQPTQNVLPYNTVCYHGEEHYFDRVRKSHSIVHKNTGHWGPLTGPGARKVREGEIVTWKEPATLLTVHS